MGDERPLPLYVEDAPSGWHRTARRDPDEPQSGPAATVAALWSAGRSALAIAEHLVTDSDPGGEGAMADVVVHHVHGYTISRHVLARPEHVVPVFDLWFARTGGFVDTRHGRLRGESRPVVRQAHQLRLVPATIRLRGSPIPVPVDLDLVAWGTYRAVLNVSLARRLVRTMGWHRRRAYFAAGHAVLESVRHALETSIEHSR